MPKQCVCDRRKEIQWCDGDCVWKKTNKAKAKKRRKKKKKRKTKKGEKSLLLSPPKCKLASQTWGYGPD